MTVNVISAGALLEDEVGRRPSCNPNLCGVGVSAQCKGNVGLRNHFVAPMRWVVCKKNAEPIRAGGCCCQVSFGNGLETL